MLHLLCNTVGNREDSSEKHFVRCGFRVESKPSELGINGSRITMALIRVDGKVVCHYTKSGGFIVMPKASDPVTMFVLERMLSEYK